MGGLQKIWCTIGRYESLFFVPVPVPSPFLCIMACVFLISNYVCLIKFSFLSLQQSIPLSPFVLIFVSVQLLVPVCVHILPLFLSMCWFSGCFQLSPNNFRGKALLNGPMLFLSLSLSVSLSLSLCFCPCAGLVAAFN